MFGSQLGSEEERGELLNLRTTAQVEKRFRTIFQREMTREERHALLQSR
jgi:hypothetical protein